jgi:D-arabinose 5-phosphate isomerase GutQ
MGAQLSGLVVPTVNDDRLIEIGRARVAAEIAALSTLASQIDDRFAAAARILRQATGKVIPVGVGTSGMTARRLAHLLSVTGTPAIFLHPTDGLHGSLGAIEPGDVVIAISKGGQSAELNEFTRLAKTRGAKTIVLTSLDGSELAALGDVTVALRTPDGADPGGVVAMGSTLIASAWGDALAAALMDARGYPWAAVLLTHPGGAVGRLAMSDVLVDQQPTVVSAVAPEDD